MASTGEYIMSDEEREIRRRILEEVQLSCPAWCSQLSWLTWREESLSGTEWWEGSLRGWEGLIMGSKIRTLAPRPQKL